MVKNGLLIVFLSILLCLTSCNPNTSSDSSSIATDSATIAMGESMFLQDCSACHNFRQDGIGPQLSGLTSEVSADWIQKFIKHPKSVIESGDERAKMLVEKFKTVMPSFTHYTDEEVNGLVAFLNTYKEPIKTVSAKERKGLLDPIPEPIELSALIVAMEPVTQIPPSSEQRPLTRITKLCSHPNTKELFILDLRGKLYTLLNKEPSVYMNMEALMPNFIHKPGHATGFGSFAFHPEFEKNGLLYTTHTESPGSGIADFDYADSIKVTLQWVLSEWKTDQPDAFPFSGRRRELFRINMVNQTHGVQEITFNPLSKPDDRDYGLLYVGIGDGGSAENGFLHLTQTPEKIWGTIIRIDPNGRNSANGQYGIPSINPFSKSDNPNVLGEVYAYGFRNPHRLTWSKSGQLLAPNIGQHSIEALNLILPGHNYGWPVREGTFLLKPTESFRNIYPLPPDDANNNFTYPVAQYDHDEGNAIMGGFEYWGSAIPQLMGKYLFADMVNGRLFYVEMKDLKLGNQAPINEWRVSLNGVITSFKELCGDDRLSLRYGRDYLGEIYLFAMPDGKVYKLVSANPLP